MKYSISTKWGIDYIEEKMQMSSWVIYTYLY